MLLGRLSILVWVLFLVARATRSRLYCMLTFCLSRSETCPGIHVITQNFSAQCTMVRKAIIVSWYSVLIDAPFETLFLYLMPYRFANRKLVSKGYYTKYSPPQIPIILKHCALPLPKAANAWTPVHVLKVTPAHIPNTDNEITRPQEKKQVKRYPQS